MKGRKLITLGVLLLVAAAAIYLVMNTGQSAEAPTKSFPAEPEPAASPLALITPLVVAVSGLVSAVTGLVVAVRGKRP